ncbi:type III secretion protein [Pseudomonas sp. CCM 7891]|uniref:Type III secretion protein n=1 Tax=Pseudomonas karstica TaxID=1055468 RepID=A0A7X2UYY3_9PSED|nr:FHA domain-containing protein [Pseudomonas karstica]MTD19933.1 type III secretion protein [Pseudomonas karstica]
MFELRVLDGLHQGAALPLFGEQWCIGAHSDADLVLHDPGIAARHVRLCCVEQRWLVQAEEGLVLDADGQALAQIGDLALNTPFSVGGIRLCVASADQPWPQKPEPVAEVLVPVSSDVSMSRTLSSLSRSMSRSQQKRLMAVLVVVALGVTALGMTSPDGRQAQASLMPAISHKTELASSYEVRQQLLKMLRERELSHRVRLQVINGQIVFDGDVSQEEMELLTRMLHRFGEQFETAVPVMSRVKERNNSFPFKIVQIVGGPNGHVVLEQGSRLFLGDEVDGLRLVSIDNGKVVFDGRQRYEVRW